VASSVTLPVPVPALRRAVVAYYLATPVLAALDAAAGLNVRARFLEGFPGWKWTYYLLCFGLGLVCVTLPRLTPLVGTLESGVNAGILVGGFFLAYYRTVAAVADGASAAALTPASALNLTMAVSAMVASLMIRAHGRPARRGA